MFLNFVCLLISICQKLYEFQLISLTVYMTYIYNYLNTGTPRLFKTYVFLHTWSLVNSFFRCYVLKTVFFEVETIFTVLLLLAVIVFFHCKVLETRREKKLNYIVQT